MSDDEAVAGGSGATGDAIRASLGPARSEREHAERLESGQAWRDFCRALERAGEGILAFPQAGHPAVRAEGFRYLLGLVESGLLQATRLADPDLPGFVRDPDSAHKWGAENADNQYLWSRIRADAEYVVSGRRRTVFDFLVEVKDGYMQLGDDRVFASATCEDLVFDADGGFEILLSAERPQGHPGNWMPLPPGARYCTVRQYLVDWEREEPASFSIHRRGQEGRPPAELSAAAMGARLDAAGQWTEQTARFWCEWIEQLRQDYEPGRIQPARRFVGGADDIVYGNDWWRLAEDEVMLVELTPPEARYWQIQLCDAWFRTFDYANRQTSLNHAQLHLDADGLARVVIAHCDPGVPNWLDTAGQPEGMLQYRYIWTRSRPEPRARLLASGELAGALPADHPVVTPAERRETIRIRQRHLERREPVT